MRVPFLSTGTISLLVSALLSHRTGAQEKVALAAKDQEVLSLLLNDCLFDPGPHGERVRVPWPIEDAWGGLVIDQWRTPGVWETRSKKGTCDGWLVKEKQGDRIYVTEGFSFPSPPRDKITRVDFVALSRAACASAKGPSSKLVNGIVTEQSPYWLAKELGEESELVVAAWLLRLGHPDLAAKVLAMLPGTLVAAKVEEIVCPSCGSTFIWRRVRPPAGRAACRPRSGGSSCARRSA